MLSCRIQYLDALKMYPMYGMLFLSMGPRLRGDDGFWGSCLVSVVRQR
jgi:hypothetical protein